MILLWYLSVTVLAVQQIKSEGDSDNLDECLQPDWCKYENSPVNFCNNDCECDGMRTCENNSKNSSEQICTGFIYVEKIVVVDYLKVKEIFYKTLKKNIINNICI